MMSWQDVANLHVLAALNWGICTAALTQAIDELEIMQDNLNRADQMLHELVIEGNGDKDTEGGT